MNSLYIIGLVSILVLFIWKKYTSHTKRRNQYIKYLQEQNQKLQSVIQEEPHPSQSIPETNNLSSSEHIPIQINEEKEVESNPGQFMGIPPELSFMFNQLPGKMGGQKKHPISVEEVDVKESFVDVNDVMENSDSDEDSDEDVEIIEDEVCEKPEFESENDHDKIPLDDLNPIQKDVHKDKDYGKCPLKPLIEENFADVPIGLYDRASITVSENDNSGIKAANSDDNRKYLEKNEVLEESLDDLIQTKQMHCNTVLSTGKNKGEMCGKKSNRDGLCKIHAK